MIRKWLLSDKVVSRLFQPRVEEDGTVSSKQLKTKLYQLWFEKGRTVPWIFSPEECYDFWKIQAGLDPSVMNRPEEYALAPSSIMKYIEPEISLRVSKQDSVYELGCSAGGKLNYLYNHGYSNLSAIELNPACQSVMEQYFPELSRNIALSIGSFEEILPQMQACSIDFLYSISALSLVHPTHNNVFCEIARVCKKYLMTVEIEWAGGQYFFPRNYRRIFEQYGLEQVCSVLLTKNNVPEAELCCYWGHVLRVYKRVN